MNTNPTLMNSTRFMNQHLPYLKFIRIEYLYKGTNT